MSCNFGAFTSKCVSALFLFHQVYLKIVLWLHFTTYFPMGVKNYAIVSSVDTLR